VNPSLGGFQEHPSVISHSLGVSQNEQLCKWSMKGCCEGLLHFCSAGCCGLRPRTSATPAAMNTTTRAELATVLVRLLAQHSQRDAIDVYGCLVINVSPAYGRYTAICGHAGRVLGVVDERD